MAVLLGLAAAGMAAAPAASRDHWSESVPISVLSRALPLFGAQAERALAAVPITSLWTSAQPLTGLNRWEALLVAHGIGLQIRSDPGDALRPSNIQSLDLLLAALGDRAAPVVPVLLGVVEDCDDEVVRDQAAWTAAVLGLERETLVAALTRAAEQGRLDRSRVVLMTREALGEELDGEAMRRRLLSSRRWSVRAAVAHAISQSPEDAEPLVEAIIERIDHDPEAVVRYHAVAALGAIARQPGVVAPTAPESLRARAAADPDPSVRSIALRTLANIAPDEPWLAAELAAGSRDPDWRVREAAGAALAGVGRGAPGRRDGAE